MTEEKSAIYDKWRTEQDGDYVDLIHDDSISQFISIPVSDLTKVIEVLFKKLEEIEKGEIENNSV